MSEASALVTATTTLVAERRSAARARFFGSTNTRTPCTWRLRFAGSSSRKPTGWNGEFGSYAIRKANAEPTQPARKIRHPLHVPRTGVRLGDQALDVADAGHVDKRERPRQNRGALRVGLRDATPGQRRWQVRQRP